MAPRGMPNLCGNSSHMSVALQVLMNTQPFRAILNDHTEECCRAKCVMCMVGNLITALQSGLEELTHLLGELYEECSGESVTDALVFFKILVSKLQDVDGDDASCNNNNAIMEMLGGTHKTIETCPNCDDFVTITEPFYVLQIPLTCTMTVQEAFESYLLGPMEKSECASCKEYERVQCVEMVEMPSILCLHFSRPLEGHQSNERRRVSISDQLIVSDTVYEFSSAILSNLKHGHGPTHYTCILKLVEGTLVQCNDSTVKNLSYGSFLSGNFEGDVVMLLYEKATIVPSQPSSPKRVEKKKNRVVSTSKKWTSEPLNINENKDFASMHDSTTGQPFIIHKRPRPDPFLTEHELEVHQEAEGETPKHAVKKRRKKITRKMDETAVSIKNGVKTIYIRCIISWELWNQNMTDTDFKFFCGLSKLNFEALFLLLDGEEGIMHLKYDYKMKTPQRRTAVLSKVSARSRLLLMLVRLRRGTPLRDLAYQFGISTSYAGFIFFGVLRKVVNTFKSLQQAMFLTRQQQQKNRPAPFRPFPNVRIIIDGVEFRTQIPSNAQQQNNTFSQYKHYNTFKYLIGISCYGGIIFVSDGFEGSKSDKEIMKKCGLMDLLEAGDDVMCDRGFNVVGELLQIGVKTIKPPDYIEGKPLTAAAELYNSAISRARIYVEHAIGKIKDFRLVRYTIPLNMRGVVDDLVFVCAYLTNFSNRAIRSRTRKKRTKEASGN